MGFIVEKNGLVKYDALSKSHGNTSVGYNPTYALTHCEAAPLEVCSLLFRTKNYTQRREVGDNCPLIYALKKKEGLFVTYSSIKGLVPQLNKIVEKYARSLKNSNVVFDAIITVPSNHKIVGILARRLSKALRVPVDCQILRKADVNDIRQELDHDRLTNKRIPQSARVQIMNAVTRAKKVSRPFSMSDVQTKNRKYITPVRVSNQRHNRYGTVLLVDDLFASGKTLVHAKNCLLQRNICKTVKAVCLFSPLNGKIRK